MGFNEKTCAMTNRKKTGQTKEQQIEYWIQSYLQAKQSGNTKLMSIFKDIIEKLGGKVPKL